MRNDMVEENMSNSHGLEVECGHGFNPLCEIVNDGDDAMVSSCGCQFEFHKIDGPFAKGADYNDMMEGFRWCSHFR